MYSGKIIDAHVHPFINRENGFAPFGSPETLDEFIMELKRCGISAVCGSVIQRGPVDFDGIRRLNRMALAIRDRFPDFYIPGIHVHGNYPEESCRELEEMHRQGVRWVGELVDYLLQTGACNSPGMFAIYETVRNLEMMVNIHCSDLAAVEDVLKNFPGMKLVLAHPEEPRDAKKRFELISRYPDAYIDLSGTGLFRWNMLRYAVDRCGSEKILFGSDFPICSPGMNLGGVFSEHLTSAELENILHKNFERIMAC